jgi:PAS domain S-box-containing protein
MNKAEKLQQLHEKMIAEIQDYAIILLDLDGTILTWNKGAQSIKGYKESEILGQNFRIFYLPRDREEKLPEKLIGLA